MAKRKSKTTEQAALSPRPRRRIPLGKITADPEVQAREALNEDTVAEYAEAMIGGAQFPPLVVFETVVPVEGRAEEGILFDYIFVLAAGFHRYAAAKIAGATDIECEVRQGHPRDAALFAVGENAVHGLRRTNADKRKAVTRLLLDKEWGQWNDHEIARRCAVSHPFVGTLRTEVTSNVTSEKESPTSPTTRKVRTRHGKVTDMRTDKIGSRKARKGGAGLAAKGPQPQPQPKPAADPEPQPERDSVADMMAAAAAAAQPEPPDARDRASVEATEAGNAQPAEPETEAPEPNDEDEFDEPVADNVAIAKLLIALGQQPNLDYADGLVIAKYLRAHADPDIFEGIAEIDSVLAQVRYGNSTLDIEVLWPLWEKHHGHEWIKTLHEEVVRQVKQIRRGTTVGRILSDLGRIEKNGSKWRLKPEQQAAKEPEAA